MVGGIAMQAGYLPRPHLSDPRQMAVWLTAGVNFLVIVGMMLASMLFVVERIERTLQEERATLRRLEDERRERLRAEEALVAAEEALRRAQMVEAAGKLAGGVAHDFNNSLMVIHGWVDLLRAGTLRGDEVSEALDSITRAVISCSQLTTRLLTLGRRDVRKPVLLDPREVLENERRSLRAIMPENIDITVDVVWPEPIHADPSQLQQVLLNLCLNARDAMPTGGRLEIRVLADEDSAAERPGTIIEVKDSGQGMEPEVQAHLFEPFFTTKGDRGTGLGLAMVQTVMRQSGGHVSVDTMLGYGTAVRLRFPPADPGLRRTPVEAALAKGPGVSILVVEDDPEVRAVIVRTLRREGHAVVEAGDVDSGLLVLAAHAGKLTLLVTDGIMPGRPVAELVDAFVQAHPDGKVLVCSGYLEDAIVKGVVGRGAAAFLSKPVRSHELARAVAELLGGVAGRPELARVEESAE
jgi:two-component system, cell cycle sensor histidine kinase and response regulator CckA